MEHFERQPLNKQIENLSDPQLDIYVQACTSSIARLSRLREVATNERVRRWRELNPTRGIAYTLREEE